MVDPLCNESDVADRPQNTCPSNIGVRSSYANIGVKHRGHNIGVRSIYVVNGCRDPRKSGRKAEF